MKHGPCRLAIPADSGVTNVCQERRPVTLPSPAQGEDPQQEPHSRSAEGLGSFKSKLKRTAGSQGPAINNSYAYFPMAQSGLKVVSRRAVQEVPRADSICSGPQRRGRKAHVGRKTRVDLLTARMPAPGRLHYCIRFTLSKTADGCANENRRNR